MFRTLRHSRRLSSAGAFLVVFGIAVLAAAGQQQRPAPAADDADRPVKTSARNPDAVALLIGISEYQDRDIPRVTYALNDVDAVQRVLTQTLGYAASRVLTLKDAQASGTRMKVAIQQRVAGMVKAGQSEVFVYYSGHGAPNANSKEPYLIPWDFDPQFEPRNESAYALKDLYADLGKLGARSVTVILESCFSGQSDGGVLLKAASYVGIEVSGPGQPPANGVVITASGAREIASWHPDKPHGLMTYYWLRAMRGEAGGDQGRVTADVLKKYLQDNVAAVARSSKGRIQTPDVVTLQPDRVLAQLPVSLLATKDARVEERTGGLEVFIDRGGELSIDGIRQGTIQPGGTFVSDKVPAGPRRIEVRKEGYETKQKDVVIIPGQRTREQFLMTANLPTTARLDRVYGLIQVSVDRGGALYIDNKKEADLPPFAPYTTPRVEAGPHQVRVERAGYVTFEQELIVRPNETARLDVALRAVSVAAPPAPPASAPRTTSTDRPATARDVATGMEFVKIQPGEFMMGCSAGDNQCDNVEKRAHRVRITKGFEIGKYEVTQAQWESVMGTNPSNFKGADRPVEQISWNDVQQFLQKLNARQDGYRYRLPSEAEWEYAARSGTSGAYAGSLDAMGWYDGNSGRQTHPVGQKQPNAWGLYDMHGNVWEWVQDWYANNYYAGSPANDPVGPSSGQFRGGRGGSCYVSARDARVSDRIFNVPTSGFNSVGFRCVREAIP